MPPDSPPAAVPAPDLPASTPPGLSALFVAFAKISLAGFGGVLVWARRGIVDQHRWMTADEFNETYALCHFLPGPNVVNLSVGFGSLSASPSPLRCAGEFRHEFRFKSDSDAWLDIRPDVAVCGGRRKCGDPGNAPGCSRCAALDDRQAICRCVRDLADVAGPERADRHPDRLCCRRRGVRPVCA